MTRTNATPANGQTLLSEVLQYRHPGVVRRYCLEYHATPEEARELFREMLKWLYLCYRAATTPPDGFACHMLPETAQIDIMWHTFLLYTQDYADFCQRYFGMFLHHVPEEEDGADRADPAEYRAMLQRQYTLVYDVLGEETLKTWYGRRRYAGGV
jgi:hypothetical protein